MNDGLLRKLGEYRDDVVHRVTVEQLIMLAVAYYCRAAFCYWPVKRIGCFVWIAESLAAMLTRRVQDLVERQPKNNMLTSTGTLACITDF